MSMSATRSVAGRFERAFSVARERGETTAESASATAMTTAVRMGGDSVVDARRRRRANVRWTTRTRRRRRETRETETLECARFERAVDDVERRFRAMRERMGWWNAGRDAEIATHAREGIRAVKERALDAARAATRRATGRLEASDANAPKEKKRRKLSSKAGQRMLRQWILEHFDAPFPDRAQKERLAEQLDWPVACVSNFFINARQRFFKPLVLDLARELEEEARKRTHTAASSVTASTETYSRKRPRD